MPEAGKTPFALAQRGIALRESKALEEAASIFTQLTAQFPHLVYGWQELAVLRAMQGDDAAALVLFERAATVSPDDPQTARHLVLHQLKLGLLAPARAWLHTHLAARPASAGFVSETLALTDFLERHPPETAAAMAQACEEAQNYLGTEAVMERILGAIAARAPFSLIRLGDGEGAWLPLGDEEWARHALLYTANRRRTLRTWFGDEALLDRPSFAAAMGRMVQACGTADVLGIPSPARFEHEYALASANGTTSNLNILRWLALAAPAGALCSQDIHVLLQLAGFFPRLFAEKVEFGLISCHPGLGLRLAERFSARITAQLIVPEEQGVASVDPSVTGLTGRSGILLPHFPVIYQRHLAALAAPQAGRVWLIAAGVLGKIYAGAIRASGGIALDIGSIADGWAGAITRPYLRKIEAFQL